MRKISLDPEAMAALEVAGNTKLRGPPNILPQWAQQVILKQVAETFFDPSMRPTFKAQLLGYSSFRAIKANWAADHFQRMMEAKYGTC